MICSTPVRRHGNEGGEMRIIGVKLLNYESIVQIKVKILRRSFRGRYLLEDYTY